LKAESYGANVLFWTCWEKFVGLTQVVDQRSVFFCHTCVFVCVWHDPRAESRAFKVAISRNEQINCTTKAAIILFVESKLKFGSIHCGHSFVVVSLALYSLSTSTSRTK